MTRAEWTWLLSRAERLPLLPPATNNLSVMESNHLHVTTSSYLLSNNEEKSEPGPCLCLHQQPGSRGDGGRSEISWEHRGHRDFQSESSCVAAIGTMCTAPLSPNNWLLVTKLISQELYGKDFSKSHKYFTSRDYMVRSISLCFVFLSIRLKISYAHPCICEEIKPTHFETYLDNILSDTQIHTSLEIKSFSSLCFIKFKLCNAQPSPGTTSVVAALCVSTCPVCSLLVTLGRAPALPGPQHRRGPVQYPDKGTLESAQML